MVELIFKSTVIATLIGVTANLIISIRSNLLIKRKNQVDVALLKISNLKPHIDYAKDLSKKTEETRHKLMKSFNIDKFILKESDNFSKTAADVWGEVLGLFDKSKEQYGEIASLISDNSKKILDSQIKSWEKTTRAPKSIYEMNDKSEIKKISKELAEKTLIFFLSEKKDLQLNILNCLIEEKQRLEEVINKFV